MNNPVLLNKDKKIIQFDFGKIVFYAGNIIGNCDRLTAGFCHILPGKANYKHLHSNCAEALHVIQGTIVHTYNDEEYTLSEGDSIVIPAGVIHYAKNIGEVEAVLAISFTSGDRITENVE